MAGQKLPQIGFIERPKLKRADFVISRLIEQTVNTGSLQKIGTLRPRMVTKARGQDVLFPPDHQNYQDYWDAYLYVDFVHRAIAAKNAAMWQEGFETVPMEKGGKFDVEKQRADDLMRALEADVVLPEGSLYAMVLGNMWWEPAYGFKTTEEDVVGNSFAALNPLDPARMAAIVDDQDRRRGTVTEWVQLDQDGKEIARWQGDELIHLRFNRYIGSPFGVGDILAILLTLKSLLYMEQKLPEIVRKRADPTLWYLLAQMVNGGLVDLSDESFRTHVDAIKLLEPTENLFTGSKVQKVEELYKSAGIAARQGVEVFLDHFKRKLQAGTAAPDVLLGEGRTTTEATAKEQTELFYQDIRWKQRLGMKRLIEREIFTRERPPILHVKIEPNPLTPDDVFQTSQRLINELRAGLIGPTFARRQLGYDEAEAAEGAQRDTVQKGQAPGSQGPSKMPQTPVPDDSEQSETVILKGGKPYATIQKRKRR